MCGRVQIPGGGAGQIAVAGRSLHSRSGICRSKSLGDWAPTSVPSGWPCGRWAGSRDSRHPICPYSQRLHPHRRVSPVGAVTLWRFIRDSIDSVSGVCAWTEPWSRGVSYHSFLPERTGFLLSFHVRGAGSQIHHLSPRPICATKARISNLSPEFPNAILPL